MNKNTALLVASFIFLLITILHLLRLYFKWEILVDNQVIPMWVSIVGALVAFICCIWMLVAKRNESSL